MDYVAEAQRIADEVLFPAALATDAADVVPAELLDELAAAGLYGLEGADFPAVCRVVEALASGCLTTTFVWVQHLGAVRAAAMSDNRAMREWLPLLSSGNRRSRSASRPGAAACSGSPGSTTSRRDAGPSSTGSIRRRSRSHARMPASSPFAPRER